MPGVWPGVLAALLVALTVTVTVLGTREVAGRLAAQAELEEEAAFARRVRQRLEFCARNVERHRRRSGALPEEHEWPECLGNRSRVRAARDPWGRTIEYVRTGPETYALICRGADGVPGGDGRDADQRIDR